MADSDSKKPPQEGEGSPEKAIFSKREEFLKMFTKSADFLKDLMEENERLRYRNLKLEQEVKNLMASGGGAGGSASETESLRQMVARLQREKDELIARYQEVEAENQDFADRYIEIEMQNNNLANLYVASYQLHSTLNFDEVLDIVMEIVINLIGAELFGILLVDDKAQMLVPVKLEGIGEEEFEPVRIGDGHLGESAKSGEEYFVDDIAGYEFRDLRNPMVAIPCKIKEHIIGVIAIYKLLEQKESFQEVDYELFTLLAGHAATAIFSSKLYSQAERKLSTMQGFIDLITK